MMPGLDLPLAAGSFWAMQDILYRIPVLPAASDGFGAASLLPYSLPLCREGECIALLGCDSILMCYFHFAPFLSQIPI